VRRYEVMPQLSLTDFVDIVSLSGKPKATKIRQVKRRPSYDPAADFYKSVRERIVETHASSEGKEYVDGILATLTDPKKVTAYPWVVQGYKKWWGRKSLVWFDAPTALYSRHGIDLSVNPELGLEIDSKPYLIKLYFKAKRLEKDKADIITNLMTVAVSDLCPAPSGTVMSVLDVRKAKLFSLTAASSRVQNIVDAELAYISALWPSE